MAQDELYPESARHNYPAPRLWYLFLSKYHELQTPPKKQRPMACAAASASWSDSTRLLDHIQPVSTSSRRQPCRRGRAGYDETKNNWPPKYSYCKGVCACTHEVWCSDTSMYYQDIEQRLNSETSSQNVFSTELAGNPLTRTQLPTMAPFLDDALPQLHHYTFKWKGQ